MHGINNIISPLLRRGNAICKLDLLENSNQDNDWTEDRKSMRNRMQNVE